MRPVTVSKTGNGRSSIVVLDDKQAPFNVGIGCVVSGTVTYSIQHTFDNVQDSTVTPTWFNNSGLTSKTANADGNYSSPVRACAINIESSSSTGTVTMTVIQSNRR